MMFHLTFGGLLDSLIRSFTFTGYGLLQLGTVGILAVVCAMAYLSRADISTAVPVPGRSRRARHPHRRSSQGWRIALAATATCAGLIPLGAVFVDQMRRLYGTGLTEWRTPAIIFCATFTCMNVADYARDRDWSDTRFRWWAQRLRGQGTPPRLKVMEGLTRSFVFGSVLGAASGYLGYAVAAWAGWLAYMAVGVGADELGAAGPVRVLRRFRIEVKFAVDGLMAVLLVALGLVGTPLEAGPLPLMAALFLGVVFSRYVAHRMARRATVRRFLLDIAFSADVVAVLAIVPVIWLPYAGVIAGVTLCCMFAAALLFCRWRLE